MLHAIKVINSVIKSLEKIKINKIVLDPFIVAKLGAKLIDNKSINIWKKKLIKQIIIITPNIPEAEILTKTKIKCVNDMINSGKILLQMGSKNVLIKGGHLNEKFIYDIFLNKNEIKIYKRTKINTKNTHEKDCT